MFASIKVRRDEGLLQTHTIEADNQWDEGESRVFRHTPRCVIMLQ